MQYTLLAVVLILCIFLYLRWYANNQVPTVNSVGEWKVSILKSKTDRTVLHDDRFPYTEDDRVDFWRSNEDAQADEVAGLAMFVGFDYLESLKPEQIILVEHPDYAPWYFAPTFNFGHLIGLESLGRELPASIGTATAVQ